MRIESWEDVDKALLEVRRLERKLVQDEADADAAIEKVKVAQAALAKPLKTVRDGYLAAIESFVREREAEMVGRTWKGTHGKVWLRRVSFVTARSWKRVLDWLLENRKMGYVHVKYQVNKEQLGRAAEDLLRAAGARIKTEDAFGYDLGEGVR